ncbi:hypothetical protein LvStA_04033 [Burkholderia gladioli]|nr:hypothetical protein LvStA_04033 [Burkholderia gladioli]
MRPKRPHARDQIPRGGRIRSVILLLTRRSRWPAVLVDGVRRAVNRLGNSRAGFLIRLGYNRPTLYIHTVLVHEHELRSRSSGTNSPSPVARQPARAGRHRRHRDRAPGAVSRTSWRWLAAQLPGRAADAAAGHRRTALAGAGARAPGAETDRDRPAAASAATGRARLLGRGSGGVREPTDTAHGRCALGCRAGTTRRHVWRGPALAARRSIGRTATPQPCGAGRLRPVFPAAPGGRRARRVPGSATPGARAGARWR